jgi:hypothetical protein
MMELMNIRRKEEREQGRKSEIRNSNQKKELQKQLATEHDGEVGVKVYWVREDIIDPARRPAAFMAYPARGIQWKMTEAAIGPPLVCWTKSEFTSSTPFFASR